MAPLVRRIDDERVVDFAFLRRGEKIFVVGSVGLDHVKEHPKPKKSRESPGGVFQNLKIIHLMPSSFSEPFLDHFAILAARKDEEQYKVSDDDERGDGELR